MGGGVWQLAGYRVEALIGAGGFGEVWRATQRSTGAAVALKRIRLTDPELRAAAVAEAAVLSALDHAHLVRLLGLERDDDAIVLVLDLAAGGSLHELLAARGRLTPGEVVTTMTAVAGALAHVHAADVVHGDVTPANILFGADGLPLLGDLGVARLVGDVKPVHTTLPYACPEVVAGEPPDPAGDVYMLGACALQALTGHPPPSVVGESDPDVWAARILAQLARAAVPPSVAAIVVRAMSLQPHRRGTSAGFALDLRHAAPPTPVELHAGRTRTEPSVARLAALAAGMPVPADAQASGPPDLVASWAPLASVASETPSDRQPMHTDRPTGTDRPARREPRHASPSGCGERGAPATNGSTHGSTRGSTRGGQTRGGQTSVPRRQVLRTTSLAVAAAFVVLPVTAGAIWWSAARGGDPQPVGASLPAAREPGPDVRSSDDTVPRALPVGISTTAVGPLAPEAVLDELGALDRVRSKAFALRDPQLLAQVYASPALLARDRAELASLVPPGCGLHGVRTRFHGVRMAAANGSRAEFVVDSTLGASQLQCGGHRAGAAPGAAVRFEVALTRTADGWRIASQEPARG